MQVTVTFDPSQKLTANQIAKVLRAQADALTARTEPENTVSEDEDENFGTTALSEEDLDDETEKPTRTRNTRARRDTEQDADVETSDSSSNNEEVETESTVSFKELRAAINQYGEKWPDQMRAILSSYKIKSPKELSAATNEKHWEPIYRKVMAKLKAARKK